MVELAAALGIAPDALWAALAASLLCGLVGTLVVLRRLVALGGGVAHAAFGGIGAALRLGVEPRLGAAAVAVLTAAVLAPLRRDRLERNDAAIGVLWAVGMAAGMLLVAGADVGSAGAVDLEGVLFGDISAVRPVDLQAIWVLDAVAIGVFALAGRRLVATAFDPDQAELQGVRTGLYGFTLLLLVALSVVALLSLVGVVLAVALLAIPPLIALRLCRGLWTAMAAAALAALLVSVAGLALAARFELPAGPAIVLVAAAVLGLVQLAPRRSRTAA